MYSLGISIQSLSHSHTHVNALIHKHQIRGHVVREHQLLPAVESVKVTAAVTCHNVCVKDGGEKTQGDSLLSKWMLLKMYRDANLQRYAEAAYYHGNHLEASAQPEVPPPPTAPKPQSRFSSNIKTH